MILVCCVHFTTKRDSLFSEREQEKLREVDLLHVADKPVGTFSGGMKRRLSVAISSIADPKMIFFDEPVYIYPSLQNAFSNMLNDENQ
jgi:ABC-2 type transport system ATP-binding protein